ncbi:MAG: DUF4421 family protein [Bdellovibrionales bacterium]|nr:DUF4421 family protein [Bdellovibrionales bacterium]
MIMYAKYFTIIFLFLIIELSFAQDRGSISWMGGEGLIIRPSLSQGSTTFSVAPKDEGSGQKLEYLPNLKYFKNIQISFWGATISYMIKEDPSAEDKFRKGKTEFSDYQFHYSIGHFGIDVFNQEFTGMYLNSDQHTEPSTYEGKSVNIYQQFPAMTQRMSGVNFFYIFNPDRFKYNSMFNQSERQLSSGGSLILTLSYIYSHIYNESAFLPEEEQTKYGEDGGLKSASLKTLGPLIGHAYNATNGEWYAAYMLSIGAGIQKRTIENTSVPDDDTGIVGRLNLRISFGYNGETLIFGSSAMFDAVNIVTDKINLSTSSNLVELFIGARI